MALDAKKLEQLSAYLDGELTPTERAEIERLVEHDTDARTHLNELRRVSQWIGDLPRPRSPEQMTGSVLERLERESLLGEAAPQPLLRFGRYSRLAGIAASVLIVCTIGWLALPQLRTAGKPERSALKVEQITLAEKSEPRSPDLETDRQDGPQSPAGQAEGLAAQGLHSKAAKSEPLGANEGRGRAAPAGDSVGAQISDATATLQQPGEREQLGREASAAVRASPAAVMPESAKKPAPSGKAATGMAFSPQPVPAIELTSIDSLLANNQASLLEVQAAPVQSFRNRLDIEVDDAATVTRLASLIESNMGRYQVDNLESAAPNDLIRNDQCFWVARPVTASDQESMAEKQILPALNDSEHSPKPRTAARGDELADADAGSKAERIEDPVTVPGHAQVDELNAPKDKSDGFGFAEAPRTKASVDHHAGHETESLADGQVFVINVPKEQAEPLIRSIQTLVEQCDSVAVWVANNEAVTADRPAEEAVRRLVNPVLFDGSDARSADVVSDDAVGESNVAGAIDTKPTNGGLILSSQPSDSKNSPFPPGEIAGTPTTQEASRQFITLAISLRTNPQLRTQNARFNRAPAEGPPASAAGAIATTQFAEPESADTATSGKTAVEPTSQGAPRD